MHKHILGIATHKSYEFPNDKYYLPIHVGKSISKNDLQLQGDDCGDNISSLNKHFCELTAHYWMWKNVKSNIYGLCHYRRYFSPVKQKLIKVKNKSILSSNEASILLSEFDIIIPKKRNYYIETIMQHYTNGHNKSDLDSLEHVLRDLYPDYLESYKKIFNSRSISLYNMFIMKKKFFFEYSEWLFNILFILEKNIQYKTYGSYQSRIFGFLAERLLNVWVENNKEKINIKYLNVTNVEGENLIKKALFLLARKFLGKKLI